MIDRGDDHGRPFIVFEYVRGRDLRERIADEGRLPLVDVVAIGEQIADALAYAHARGVIHRDVKPHNILLTPDGQPKLTDFGIARVLEQPGLTMEGRVLGTGDYLAPEQAAGETIDARADVYALGVLLYHALCGDVPFHADSYVETARLHAQAPIPSVRDVRPDAPERLDEIVDARAREAARRPLPGLRSAARRPAPALARAAARRPRHRRVRPHAARADPGRPSRRSPRACAAARRRAAVDPIAPAPEPADRVDRAAAARPRRRRRAGRLPRGRARLELGDPDDQAVNGRADDPARGHDAVDRPPPTLAPVKLAGVTSYDPQGDDSESQYLAPRAIDASPSTFWRTETYKGSENDLAGKGGVGSRAGRRPGRDGRQLRVSTPTPGWTARGVLDALGDDPARPDGLEGRVGRVHDVGRDTQGDAARPARPLLPALDHQAHGRVRQVGRLRVRPAPARARS